MQGALGAVNPPKGSGGLKPPRNSEGSGGRQSPSKSNFMDPGYDIFLDQDQDFGTRIGYFWDQDQDFGTRMWYLLVQKI